MWKRSFLGSWGWAVQHVQLDCIITLQEGNTGHNGIFVNKDVPKHQAVPVLDLEIGPGKPHYCCYSFRIEVEVDPHGGSGDNSTAGMNFSFSVPRGQGFFNCLGRNLVFRPRTNLSKFFIWVSREYQTLWLDAMYYRSAKGLLTMNSIPRAI